MADGVLGSDHVNYLIFRYLQESGHANAAKALYQDWHRPDEYREPEAYPFASVVRPNELVNILQDGLRHDQLLANATNEKRRFNLLDSRLSRPSSRQQDTSTKPSSRRASTFVSADQDDFPTPAAKRPRRSNGSEVYLNGDAMDIDRRDKEDGESVSVAEQEAAPSEPAVDEEVVETTTAATQTDKETKIKTQTLYWTLDKREPTSILDIQWNPEPSMGKHLLTVGESLCRMYQIPAAIGDGDDVGDLLPFINFADYCPRSAMRTRKVSVTALLCLPQHGTQAVDISHAPSRTHNQILPSWKAVTE